MKTLGVGMVGARYGARMHLANYAKLPCEMVAVRGVCSRTKESATALAQEKQIAFVTDDYDALLVIGFEDGSRGTVIVSDVGLGGLNTAVECVNVIFAAYQSDETRHRVTLT
jgi:hypothetical protein